MALAPILKKLASYHPRLVVETHTNDGFVDIVADGLDAGIRLGESVQQDMVAVRLTPPFSTGSHTFGCDDIAWAHSGRGRASTSFTRGSLS